MARLHGKRGQLLMDPAGGTTYAAVGDINAWSLNLSKDKVNVTAFGDTNQQKVVGLPDFAGTFGGFWNSVSSGPLIFDAVLGDIPVGLKLVMSTLEATNFFSGLAFLDGNIEVSSNGSVNIGGTFDAASNWTLSP